jgi:hypothetical protein
MIEFAIVLKSIGDAIGLAKAVGEAKAVWETADLKYKMAEVTGALADAKIALTDAQVELRDKDKEIERLRNAFARRDETVEHAGRHYRKGRDGQPTGRAFCPVCWENEGRLFMVDQGPGRVGSMVCARCKSEFDYLPSFAEESRQP